MKIVGQSEMLINRKNLMPKCRKYQVSTLQKSRFIFCVFDCLFSVFCLDMTSQKRKDKRMVFLDFFVLSSYCWQCLLFVFMQSAWSTRQDCCFCLSLSSRALLLLVPSSAMIRRLLCFFLLLHPLSSAAPASLSVKLYKVVHHLMTASLSH